LILFDFRHCDPVGNATWQTATSGASKWTASGTNIHNNNTGKVLVGAITTADPLDKGRLYVKEDVAFGMGIRSWTTGAYANAIYAADSAISGNPIGCTGCTGNAAIRGFSRYGDALYAHTTNGRGIYVKGGHTTFHPAMVIDTNHGARALQVNGAITIADGTHGVGKVLTSDADGNASWQAAPGAVTAGSGISIAGGVISATDNSATNELQTLSLTGATLTLSGGGGSVVLPSSGSSPWNTSGTHIYNSNTGNLGIGTTAPVAKLHVADNSVLFSASGMAVIPAANPPLSGEGRRMMWYADKAAFRAGYASGNEWDNDSTGNYSAAIGYMTKAVADHATALGYVTTATGPYATAMGGNTTASGSNATAMGYNSIASGAYATAMGVNSIASGTSATAMGYYTTASGNGSTAIGGNVSTNGKMGAVAIGDRSTAAIAMNDADNQMMMRFAGGYRLYTNSAATQGLRIESNGVAKYTNNVAASYDSRSLVDKNYVDSLTVHGASKWTASGSDIYNGNAGNVGIGTSTPAAKLEVVGTLKFVTGEPAPGKVLTSDAYGNASWQEATTGSSYTAGSGITITDGEISAEDNSATNELQTLSLSGSTLTLSAGGGSVSLPTGEGGSYWAVTGINISNTNAGRVGIGTNTPLAKLHVADSSVVFTTSGADEPIPPPVSGTGGRMMWYADKMAFRAGYAESNEWDMDSIGFASTALGYGSKAKGVGSFASGYRAEAKGFASIAMGNLVEASGSFSIAMGENTDATALNANAIGSYVKATGEFSTALGNRVSTNNRNGSFIIGDFSTTTITNATADNQMTMRFAGGYRLMTTSSGTTGVSLAGGGNAWSVISDRRKKENFSPVDGEAFLKKISKFNLTSWNYKGQDPTTYRHYGPMAQDFYAAFGNDGVGTAGNDTTINQADMDGVSFIAIQALVKRTEELQKKVNELESKNSALANENTELKAELNRKVDATDRRLEQLEMMIREKQTAKKQ
jgi:hypothetical protein